MNVVHNTHAAKLTMNNILKTIRYFSRTAPLPVQIMGIVAVPLLFAITAGFIYLWVLEQPLGFIFNEGGGRQVLPIIGIALAAGLLLAYVLTLKFVRPFQRLMDAVGEGNKGDLPEPTQYGGKDKIKHLEESVYKLLSNQAGFQQALHNHNLELESVNELGEVLTLGQGVEAVVETALNRVITLMKMDVGSISLFEHPGRNLVLKASQGFLPHDFTQVISNTNNDTIFTKGLYETGRAVAMEDVRETTDLPEDLGSLLARDGFISWTFAPLKMEGEVIGIYHLGKRGKRSFTSHDLTLLEIIGNVVGSSLSSAQLLRDLRRKEAELRRALHRAVDLQEDERKRLARELHDEVGQALTSILIRLKTLQEADFETMVQRIEDLRSLTSQTIEELRRIAIDLRPAALDALGIIPALRWYVQQCAERTGLDIFFKGPDQMERLSANQELSLYRVAQEGITNAIRHGKPRKIEVTLDKDLDCIRLIIYDNGRGINPEVLDQGLGLIGIRERVDLLNGNFVIDTTPGEGTLLKVEIPIKR